METEEQMMNSKIYKLPNGMELVFNYDNNKHLGKISLECMDMLMGIIADRPDDKWIPIIKREATQEEKDNYYIQHGEELCYVLENEMPLDGQEVLVSCSGIVSKDVFYKDNYGFKYMPNKDVDAWMPMPKGYKKAKKCCSDCKHHTDGEEIHGVTPCGSCGIDKKNFKEGSEVRNGR